MAPSERDTTDRQIEELEERSSRVGAHIKEAREGWNQAAESDRVPGVEGRIEPADERVDDPADKADLEDLEEHEVLESEEAQSGDAVEPSGDESEQR